MLLPLILFIILFMHLYIPYRLCFIGYVVLEKLHVEYIYAPYFFLLSFISNIKLITKDKISFIKK